MSMEPELGIRQFVSDNLQFDAAFGKGFGVSENKTPAWFSCGIRYVLSFNPL